jgi:hypothetical protein
MIVYTKISIAIVVSTILIAGTASLTEFNKSGTAFACDTPTGGTGQGGGSQGSGSGFTGGLGEGCNGHGVGGIDPPLGPCGGGGQYDSGHGGKSAGPTCQLSP